MNAIDDVAGGALTRPAALAQWTFPSLVEIVKGLGRYWFVALPREEGDSR